MRAPDRVMLVVGVAVQLHIQGRGALLACIRITASWTSTCPLRLLRGCVRIVEGSDYGAST